MVKKLEQNLLKQLKETHTVMVGISTEQNTANLVPFSQFEQNTLFLAETEEAKAAHWSTGPAQVMKKRGNEFCPIPIGKGDDLPYITATISDFIKDKPSICWNFGGGQKLQQLALFNLFLQRLDAEKNDWACYTDPKARTTHIIKTDDKGDFQNSLIDTDAWLTLEEIVLIFGNKLMEGSGQCLWSRAGNVNPNLPQLSPDEVTWFDEYTKRQRMFTHFDLDKFPNDGQAKVYPGRWTKIGDYFERFVAYKVAEIIAGTKKSHTVNEVWADVKVDNKRGGEEAQYDVLLLTNFGTIIPLDAKIEQFSQKDEDARSFKLHKISGKYTTFYSVYPYFLDDLQTEDSVLHNSVEGRRLLAKPFEMQERGSRMLVLSEKGNKDVSLIKTKNNKIRAAGENDKNALKVYTLESMLEYLKLYRTQL